MSRVNFSWDKNSLFYDDVTQSLDDLVIQNTSAPE
jgi:hypothetical protein